MTKNQKLFIGIGAGMLLLALVAGVYVWVALINYQKDVSEIERGTAHDSVGAMSEQPMEEVGTNVPAPKESPSTESSDTAVVPTIAEPIVIQKADLSETQQKLFDVLGFEGETVTITPEMVTCAEGAVGSARFSEIINGSAPGPIEAAKLVSCVKN